MEGSAADPLAWAVFAFGLVLGSFLNVVIHRLPRGESIVFPASHCPACSAPIRWFHNLPVVSWLLLRGRCAACKAPISARYPLVELAAAAALLLVFLRFGAALPFLLFAPFALALVALFAIDLEHKLLPDAITLPGVALGLAVSPWNPQVTWKEAVAGAALGYGVLWALAGAYERLRGIEGMGRGDFKLTAMIGAFAGPKSILAVLLLASLGGLAVGLTMMIFRRADWKSELPFGCFLAPAALIVALLGPDAMWTAWQDLLLRTVYGVDAGGGDQ